MLLREPIRRRKLYEEVAARLEAAISEGVYRPGDQLPSEREIMETFKVGRTSVREALFALKKMGLITISSGERARVIEPTAETLIGELSGAARQLLAQPDGVRHFQHARRLFEMALARNAASTATEADLEELVRALEANRRAIGDPDAFPRTDIAFHFVLATISRNPIFVALHHAIEAWLAEQRQTSIRASGSDKAAHAAHKRIYEAIAQRQPDAAEAAMRDHLAEVEQFYWKVRAAERRERPRS